jgi:hypothetical protein
MVANQIGRTWPTLYLTLPFVPARDTSRRVHDIETLDHRSVSTDRTYSACAHLCLARWRRLSQKCSVKQLVLSLYKIDHTQLGHEIGKHYLEGQSVS